LATYFLGRALHNVGDHDEALPLLLQAFEQLRGDSRMANRVRASLGALYRTLGRADEARDHLERAVAVFRESGVTHYEAEALLELRAIEGVDVAELDARLREL
jgi:tetratricopeptide (TPR) repeat protein